MKAHPKSIAAAFFVLACVGTSAGPTEASKDQVQRGRYLIQVSGCNDCHTPNYGSKNGQVDDKLWLTGDALGWAGPWGTTYATNLRLMMADMNEQQWIHHARNMRPRPPMPWFNVRAMSDTDLKAIYAFTRSLGPGGAPVPAYVPPGKRAVGPVVQFPE